MNANQHAPINITSFLYTIYYIIYSDTRFFFVSYANPYLVPYTVGVLIYILICYRPFKCRHQFCMEIYNRYLIVNISFVTYELNSDLHFKSVKLFS